MSSGGVSLLISCPTFSPICLNFSVTFTFVWKSHFNKANTLIKAFLWFTFVVSCIRVVGVVGCRNMIPCYGEGVGCLLLSFGGFGGSFMKKGATIRTEHLLVR